MVPPYALPVFALTFAYLCLGLFYLVLYLKSRRRDVDNLVFAILSVVLAGYSFCSFRLYLSTDVDQGRHWLVGQFAFAIPALVLFVHFFWIYLKVPRSACLPVLYVVAASFLSLDLFSHAFFTHDPLIKVFHIGRMSVTYYEVESGPAAFFFYAGVVLALGWILVRFQRAPKELADRLGPVRVSFAVLSACVINDLLVVAGAYDFLYLLEYGFFAFAVGMAAILLNRYADLANGLERAVEERTRELIRVGEALAQSERLASAGMLAATLSHEVRNPLAVILSTLDVLQEEVTTAEGREMVASAREEVRRISGITSDLLTLARPGPRPVEPLDVNALVTDFLTFYRRKLVEGRIKIETSFDKNRVKVDGHPGLVQQALLNVVKNAAEAMPEGGRIRIRTMRRKGGVEIEIEDTGPGLPPDHESRMFQPFFSTKQGQGNGLGLFITRAILESTGGTIEAESAPGTGAVFRIFLPESRGG